MTELFCFIGSFIVTFALTGVILRFSLRRSLLDIPNDRSSHTIAKPRLGGVAITVSFFLVLAVLFIVGRRPFPSMTIGAGYLFASVMIAVVGLRDDLRGLSAGLKLLAQIAATVIVIASGVILREFRLPLVGTLELGVLAAPITAVWILGIVNFYNFIDGIDGLAAGMAMIASLFLVFIGRDAGAPALGVLYAALAGSSFGFLRYNFPPARIFMGDMGSTFIGFTFAVLSIVGAGAGVPAFVTLLLLGAVLGDAALTLFRRLIGGNKLFEAHRAHYYQRLISLGLSHKQVTMLEYLIAIMLGTSAFFLRRSDSMFVTIFSVIWLGFFMWALMKIRSMERGGRMLAKGKALAIAFGDLVFIAASYILGYYLRLNFRFPAAETGSMLVSLPIVLVIRTAVFYYYGLYRGVWRYTNVDDLLRIVKAVTLSTVIMIVSFTLIFRFQAFPRSVFIIDWFILIVFLAGSRIAVRWFHELPSREEITARRIVIGGSGPMAEVLVQRLRKTGNVHQVGLVDDREEMRGRVLGGLEVLGSFHEIDRIVREQKVDELFLLDPYHERISEKSWQRLRGMDVSIKVINDTSDLPAARHAGGDALAGRTIVAAGNGRLVEMSPRLFSRAAEIAVCSDDPRIVDGIALQTGSGCAVFLGLLGDREGFARLLEMRSPEFVLADFAFRENGLANALEGYVRSVLLPLDRTAQAAACSPDTRFIACMPAASSQEVEAAVTACELILLGRFESSPGRICIIRYRPESTAIGWGALIAGIAEKGLSGRFVTARETDGPGYRLAAAPETPARIDPSDALRSIIEGARAGEDAALARALMGVAETAAAIEHE